MKSRCCESKLPVVFVLVNVGGSDVGPERYKCDETRLFR